MFEFHQVGQSKADQAAAEAAEREEELRQAAEREEELRQERETAARLAQLAIDQEREVHHHLCVCPSSVSQ